MSGQLKRPPQPPPSLPLTAWTSQKGPVLAAYAGTLVSAIASLTITETATSAGLAEELNPTLAVVLNNPPLAYSLVAGAITAAFVLIGATLHILARFDAAVSAVGRLGYAILLGVWVADAARDAVLVATRTEPLSLVTALSVGTLACIVASRRLLAGARPTAPLGKLRLRSAF